MAQPRDERLGIVLGEFCRIGRRRGKCPRRMLRSSPGCPKGSDNLPWDATSIQRKRVSRPEVNGWDGVLACAKAAGGDTRRVTGGNGIAATPTVCVSYDDGRQPSGSVNGERQPRVGRNMPRRNASGVGARRARRVCRLGRLVGGARGHAIKKFLPGRFAIGPAVSSLLEFLLGPPHTTAATSAARPCAAYAIANVSGSPARQKPAA